MSGELLATQNLSVRVGARLLLRELSMSVAVGEFVAVLGRNGSGKSLTLHTLAGLRATDAGSITLCGQPIAELSRRTIAQRLGLLPQDREDSLPLTVFEAALLARHPHLGAWRTETETDRDLAHQALARFGLTEYAQRELGTLSGGEQRRAAMAALLTQQPRLYLLDEPTNHLDPHHQIQVLDLFRGLSRDGAGIIATLHDPTLAERFADRVLLLYGDGRWRLGPTAEILSAAELSELYLTPISAIGAPGRRAFIPA